MDFTLDAEQRALRDTIRSIAAAHAPTRTGDVPVGPGRHDSGLWSALADAGALGLPFAEESGGFGASAVEAGIVATELGRGGLATAFADALVAGSLLAQGGSELLDSVIDGSALVMPVLAEPGRAYATMTQTTASRTGDDWTVSGTRGPVPAGSAATHVIVPADTGDGVGIFLVESPSITDGLVELDDTAASLLVAPEQEQVAMSRAVALGTVVLCAEAVGAMDAALTMTAEYLKSRKQFGVPLMTFQTLTQRAADMYMSVELARSTALFATMALAEDPDDWATASRAKVVVGQTGRHVGQEAIQLHGGIGMTAEYAVGHLTTRLTEIEQTFGSTRQHLGWLGQDLRDHESVDVLG